MGAAAAYRAACLDHNMPPRLPGGELRTLWLEIENRGTRTWDPGVVRLMIRLDGAPVTQVDLPHSVPPGQRVTLHWVFRATTEKGSHRLEVDLAGPEASCFTSDGGWPLRLPFHVDRAAATETGRLRDRVLQTHARSWLPCDGVSWSTAGPGYPMFAQEARGCRIVDVEGRTYVDYLMGWGSALLGYAPDRIRRAVQAALASGANPTLTHRFMPEVADALCAMFPGAEAATFGKNGSDVCSAAVRMARVYTGRPVVLVCGYHGWQDWYVERWGFPATGVPQRDEPLVLPFEPNNLSQVAALLAERHGRVAAVMLEPAGVIEGTSGPIREADHAFLRELVALAHREGALVIFDEILTGFRHPGGSVQRAAGVVPDLTCVGKALSAGLPLSALVGRRDVFASTVGRIHYEPTFKGETYSLAAAREALALYRERDVPQLIGQWGERLRSGLDALCAALAVPARMIGPPYRMMLVFDEPEPRRRLLMRTLFQQELIKGGVLTTQNLFLPCLAHDEEAFDLTLRALRQALERVVRVAAKDRFASALEIPPLPG